MSASSLPWLNTRTATEEAEKARAQTQARPRLPPFEMPFIPKIQRQSDYRRFPSSTPIVIDNGASYFRIGWAGETEPRVNFRNIVQRPRHKATGETVTIFGDHDPALLKYFDCTRLGPCSAFENNVVFQFEIMEYILDFAFDRLGANGSQIDHPILITECVCNPFHSRSKMAELLFETYGVPSIVISFSSFAAFSYKYNQQIGVCDKDGLAICPCFTTTYVIPVCFLGLGNCLSNDLYSNEKISRTECNRARFTWEKVEDLKVEHCYIAPDYVSESRLFQCNRARFTWEKVEDLKVEHCYIAPDYVSESRLFQLKEKKRQLFLKTTSEGRQQAKQKRHEEELDLEKRNQQDEKKRFIERFRCPEISVRPNWIGIDRAGLAEMAGVSLRRLPTEFQELEERLTSLIFMTGGSSLFPGMSGRLDAGIRLTRPCGSPIRIAKALDPILDAWRGASAYAAASHFPTQTFSKEEYFEVALIGGTRATIVLIQTKPNPKRTFLVLDAPSLQDDFYLNLVDWSSQNVLAVGLGTSVYLWSATNSKVTKLCDLGPNDGVCSVQWTREGSYLSIGTSLGRVQVWDGTQCKRVRTMGGHQTRTGVLAWNSRILASGSRDRNILQHDLRVPDNYISKLVGHKSEVCGLKWSNDDRELASGGNDNQLLVWNQHSQQPALRLTEHTAAVKAIAWSPHQSGLLASGGGTADRCIRFWNTTNGHQLNSIDTGSQVCNLAWSKNVNEIVSTHGYSQNQIMVWKYPSMGKVATLTGHSMRVLYLAMSPDGQTIVTGAGDETLRFWNVFPSVKTHTSVKDTGLWSLGRTQIR
ncbi:hypothetical protein C1H46_029240 [Malus baccata]|uniref:CDC20/Fizzy WD40 domain-containing protein n=1 Tax=Malus baccata TaxID=106549 RepID=A0A540LFU1_MALBA|nr:hypothetical protein C1H46_029240 [Malus baccata]